jgi:hypothetical protein
MLLHTPSFTASSKKVMVSEGTESFSEVVLYRHFQRGPPESVLEGALLAPG